MLEPNYKLFRNKVSTLSVLKQVWTLFFRLKYQKKDKIVEYVKTPIGWVLNIECSGEKLKIQKPRWIVSDEE